LIEITSGHLSSGTWRFKTIDDVVVLANVQSFNRHGEFRIGPAQVTGFKILEQHESQFSVKIFFTDGTYCCAYVPAAEMTQLDAMVASHAEAPIEVIKDNPVWVKGFVVFIVACIIFEFIK